MTSIVAFCLIAAMLSAYTLLDGYDLGAGAIAPLLARTRGERSAVVESIGPFWSGNEVWLVAAGGTLFALFPRAYAVSFSGFYLPFIVVLWLLMFRGIAIELRERLPSEMWMDFWDVAFSVSSALLILLFGVALGNLVRGLPLDADGYFSGSFASLLNLYSTAVGVLAVLALVQHGLAYIADNVVGLLGERALRFIAPVWWLVTGVYLAVTAATIAQHRHDLASAPFATIASAFALAALVVVGRSARLGRARPAFWASVAFLAGLLAAAAATMYPYLLRPFPGAMGSGLTIFQASPPAATLATSVFVASIGLIAVIAYSVFIRRRLLATVTVRDESVAS
jgi:cytochrome d ubiquinol oxidase subunit II